MFSFLIGDVKYWTSTVQHSVVDMANIWSLWGHFWGQTYGF